MRFLHSSFVAVQRLFARHFFSELATTTITTTKKTNTTSTNAGSHLRVCGHRQYRNYRSYREGSHFPPLTTEPETYHGSRDSFGALNQARCHIPIHADRPPQHHGEKVKFVCIRPLNARKKIMLATEG